LYFCQLIDQWDYRNRLIEVDSVIKGVASIVAVFTYDALNRQIGRADYTGGSAPAPTAPTVGDAGFEAVSVGQGGYAYGPSNSAWTFTSQSGLTGNNSAFTNGDPAAPQGTQVAFLQSYGTISQAVAGWAAGSYTISFQAIQRAGNNQNFQVLVDGAVVGSFQPAGSTYQTDTTAAFTVGAGSHTITFQGIDTVGGDNTAFFDAVSVASAGGTAPQATAAVPATYVADPGFDAVVVGPGGYAYNPAGSPWAFNGQAGLSGNASGFTNNNPNAPQGQQVAFLQTTGTLTQTITVAVAGSYQLAFAAAQRAGNNQDFQVLVDGTVVGTFRPAGSSYEWYGTAAFSVAAGSHTLTFRGLDSAGGDNTAFLDAVSLSGLATPAPSGASAVRWTVYDDQTPLLDFNGAGTLQARYLSVPGAIDELLARQTSSGVAWYLDDRLGSVRDLIDNSGTVIDHVDYGVYGQVQAESTPTQGDRFKYAGMEFDAAIGLYYDRARYYDPATGRFISQDPTGFETGDTNLYRYTLNNSSNIIDPSGLDPILPLDGNGQLMGDVPDKVDKTLKCDQLRQALADILKSIDSREGAMVYEDMFGDGRDKGHILRKKLEEKFRDKLKDRIRTFCDGGNNPQPAPVPKPQQPQPKPTGPSMRASRPGDRPYNPYQGIPPWFLREYGITPPGEPGIITEPGRVRNPRIPRVPSRTPSSPRVPVRR